MPFQLLAADVGNWVGLIILVITVLGWIVNAIKGNDANGNPLPKQRPKPNKDLRSEIEIFLEELNRPKAERPAPVFDQEPPSIRPVPPAPRASRPLPPAQVNPPKSVKPTKQKNSPTNRGQTKAQRKRPTSGVITEQGVSPHLASHLDENRVNTLADHHLTPTVAQSVREHLSGGTVAPLLETSSADRRKIHPVLSMLKSPEGVQQAVILNEILQRPRSLRPRS